MGVGWLLVRCWLVWLVWLVAVHNKYVFFYCSLITPVIMLGVVESTFILMMIEDSTIQ